MRPYASNGDEFSLALAAHAARQGNNEVQQLEHGSVLDGLDQPMRKGPLEQPTGKEPRLAAELLVTPDGKQVSLSKDNHVAQLTDPVDSKIKPAAGVDSKQAKTPAKKPSASSDVLSSARAPAAQAIAPVARKPPPLVSADMVIK